MKIPLQISGSGKPVFKSSGTFKKNTDGNVEIKILIT
jgi:hypothetical protein